MLTKDSAGNGWPRQEVARSGVTCPSRHHEETSFPDGRCSALGWLSSTAGRLGVLMLDRVTERRRAAQLARHYRDQEGLSIAEIARRLGRAEATIKTYLYDPSYANKRPRDSPQERQFWALAGHARTSICKPLLGSRCDGTRPAFPTARFVRVRKSRASL